jgi:hypothetical protein
MRTSVTSVARAAVAAVAAMAACTGMASAQCAQWSTQAGGDGNWYESITLPGSYSSIDEPVSLIAARGATPAVFETAAEWTWYVSAAPGLANEGNGHLGYFRPSFSFWRRYDGSPMGFTRWMPGTPNNSAGQFVAAWAHPASCGTGCWEDYGAAETGLRTWVIEYRIGEATDVNGNGIPDNVRIVTQPTDQSLDAGDVATFSVKAAAAPLCTTSVTFQWQRRDPNVADPQAPDAWIDLANGDEFANVDRATMTVLTPTAALATGFRCTIRGGCGCETATTDAVHTNSVNYSFACPSDFNDDGGIDFSDVEGFFERWEAGC